MLPARRRWWRMSPHTSSVLRPTRSRPRAPRPPSAMPRLPAGSSAVGSANNFRMRFATSSWRISGCETRSAGRCSSVDRRCSHCGPDIGPTRVQNRLGGAEFPQCEHRSTVRRAATELESSCLRPSRRRAVTIIQRGVEERRTPGTVRPDCLLALDRSLCARHSRTRTSVSNPSRSPRPAIHSESGHPNEETTRRAYDSAGPSGDVWVDRRQRIEVNSFASENYAIEVARAHFEAETTRRSHETLSWLPPPKLLAEHPLEVGSSDKPAVSLRRSLRIPQFDGLRVLKSRNPQSGFNSVDGGDQFRKLVRQGQVVDLAAHCRWAKRA